jgi:hypothetical protein
MIQCYIIWALEKTAKYTKKKIRLFIRHPEFVRILCLQKFSIHPAAASECTEMQTSHNFRPSRTRPRIPSQTPRIAYGGRNFLTLVLPLLTPSNPPPCLKFVFCQFKVILGLVRSYVTLAQSAEPDHESWYEGWGTDLTLPGGGWRSAWWVTQYWGRAISQAVSRWLPTAAARVHSRVSSSGICGEQSGAGVGCFRVLRFLQPIFIPSKSPSS